MGSDRFDRFGDEAKLELRAERIELGCGGVVVPRPKEPKP